MGSAVKSVEKTISKIIPNEVKPVLPYLSVAAPWLSAAGYLGAGLEGLTPFQSALFGAGTNLASQVATGQAAKHGINPVTLALSGAGGYLTAPGTASQLEAAKIIGDTSSGNAVTLGDVISTDPTKIGSETLAQAGLPSTLPNDVSVGNISNLQSLENVGTQGLASLSSRAAPTLNQSIQLQELAKLKEELEEQNHSLQEQLHVLNCKFDVFCINAKQLNLQMPKSCILAKRKSTMLCKRNFIN